MKIVCPECQAAYEINVPESSGKDLSAKCAVCNNKFPIKKKTLAEASHAQDSMDGPPLAQIDSGWAPEPTDDFLSGLQEDPEGFGDLDPNGKESSSEDDKNLDDYLDQLLEEGFDESSIEILDESQPPLAEDTTPPASDMPSEEDLDRLFDSLIADEIKPQEAEENPADSSFSPENHQEEKDLNTLLDEIIQSGLDEEEGIEPITGLDETESALIDSELLATENEEIDQPAADPLGDAGHEIASPETENISAEKIDVDLSNEEDPVAEAPPEENTLNELAPQEDAEETSEDPQETVEETVNAEAVAEPKEEEKGNEGLSVEPVTDQETVEETADAEAVAEPQEEEKSDDDLWAEAFADQETVEETADAEAIAEPTEEEKGNEGLSAEPVTNQETVEETADAEAVSEPQEEEKSDDDLWAEAFADQETVEETADAEAIAEPPKEEKDDEDLWAEAFADQGALKDTDEKGDAEKKTEEAPETVDQEEEEGAEETVEAEAVKESDKENSSEKADSNEDDDADAETTSDEDDVADEEPETNEFGISESDYEDDDDEVGDQYDAFGEDEEEFSPPEKKKSVFSLPSTRTGKLVLGGGVLAVLLTGGGAYFALQTLAPPELTQMTKTTSVVPEGLKPKNINENPAPENKTGHAAAPTEKPNPALTAALGTGNAPSLAKETGNPPSEAESGSGVSKGLVAALAPGNHAVQLATIMPVAYNINDIRVLSFSLEAEMSDAESAQVIREALPVFEKITITTVEKLMDKKFFNDILYVKEKLKKNLQTNFNKTLEGGGRVTKVTFKEFTVQ